MTKPVIYLIGSLANARIVAVGNVLRAAGYDAFNSWFSPGPEADLRWKSYEEASGRTYTQALKGYAAQHIFEFDHHHIQRADIGVILAPCGKSGWVEGGYMVGTGKPVFMCLDGINPEKWDVMAVFFTDVFNTVGELIEGLPHA